MSETNLNTMTDFGEIAAIDFVEKFSKNVTDLLDFLNVSRREQLSRDQTFRTYKWETKIDDSTVGEGEEIPLSKVTRKVIKEHQLEWFKKRRSVSAEAIARHGRDIAVTRADGELMRKLQFGFETKFLGYLKAAPTKIEGEGLQKALTAAWAKLTSFNAFRGAEFIYFVSPQDVADFLGNTPVSAESSNVFGMTLLKNFIGIGGGAVVMLNSVPKGKVYATAIDNLVFDYLNVRSSDIGNQFAQFTDSLGLIGASRDVVQNRLTLDTVFFGANVLFAEVPEGVVEATIAEAKPAVAKPVGVAS